jgi:hypothetical protein
MRTPKITYEVPMGVVEVGKDELPGAAGNIYPTECRLVHPRVMCDWVNASDSLSGVTISSDQEVMPLPAFAAQLSYYFDFYLVKNVLKLQIGADLFYNTAYKGYAFNPASGLYHSQNTTSFGNYPWVDFFVAAKWKEVTPFIKYEHADQGMVSPSSYFSALHYPRNPSVLKFGISWNFYD